MNFISIFWRKANLYISMSDRAYPNLVNYSRYLKIYESLDKYEVFEEMDSLKRRSWKRYRKIRPKESSIAFQKMQRSERPLLDIALQELYTAIT